MEGSRDGARMGGRGQGGRGGARSAGRKQQRSYDNETTGKGIELKSNCLRLQLRVAHAAILIRFEGGKGRKMDERERKREKGDARGREGCPRQYRRSIENGTRGDFPSRELPSRSPCGISSRLFTYFIPPRVRGARPVPHASRDARTSEFDLRPARRSYVLAFARECRARRP